MHNKKTCMDWSHCDYLLKYYITASEIHRKYKIKIKYFRNLIIYVRQPNKLKFKKMSMPVQRDKL